jgi:hypothetical protein
MAGPSGQPGATIGHHGEHVISLPGAIAAMTVLKHMIE